MEDSVPKETLGERITTLAKAYLSMLEDIIGVVTLEARLALKSLIYISIILASIVLLLICCWICLLASLFVGLMALGLNSFISLLLLVALNLMIIVALLGLIYKFKQNLRFKATRKQINNFQTKEQLYD